MKKKAHINVFIASRGHHEASWRHPESFPNALTDIEYYQNTTKKAEEGLLDSIFLGDHLSVRSEVRRTARTWLEPITVLSALAVNTSKIGLIATASTTYTEPFNLARQFASLDHISNGRIGWNIVTSWLVEAAQNYGDATQVSHSDRYKRAEEFMTVVKGLWDSWSDDAVIDDRESGLYADYEKILPINHQGDYYNVTGPLNIPRSPQGRPVFVQAGSSETGRRFASRHAEAVFTAQMEKKTAQDFYESIKSLVKSEGRDVNQTLILPGLSPVIGSTESEANEIVKELDELSDPEVGRERLSNRFGGADLSHLPMDKPLSPEDFPDPETVQAARSRTEVIVGIVEREKPTLRRLLSKLATARGHFLFTGTPEQVADLIEDWLNDGVSDGINLMPPLLPHVLDIFVDEVVPILQKRGLFRTSYEGTTLRSHYGLDRPDKKS
ncbi:MAG: LLM class flavin-dependent oxidoreductase [Nitrospinota bacterium]|nr:LLM class flavin-dependent oxidoreductase [Nitrospinota bacterium]